MLSGNPIISGPVRLVSCPCYTVCYLWRDKTIRSNGQRVGSLAKRGATAVGRHASAAQERMNAAAEQDYPISGKQTPGGIGEVSAEAPTADKKSPPSMQEVFGPGGLLER